MNETAPVPLSRQLRRAAQALRDEHPPPEVLQVLHARLDRRGTAPAAPRLPRWGVAGLAAACAVLLAWVMVAPTADRSPAADLSAAAGFVALPGAEQWRRQLAEGRARAWLVSTELSPARMAALGLPYDPARPTERVPAQLLVHSSGDVLAIRFVR